MPVRATYPKHITEAMEKKKLGIYQIATLTKLSVPTVRKVLLGENSGSIVFREAAKKQLADTLGIPVEKL